MTIKLFGIAKEMIGDKNVVIDDETIITVGELKQRLSKQYPSLKGLKSWAIAVDTEYAADEKTIDNKSEIALLPPVSGG